jgi:hypothetical protein
LAVQIFTFSEEGEVEEPEKKPGMDNVGARLFLFGRKHSEGGETNATYPFKIKKTDLKGGILCNPRLIHLFSCSLGMFGGY